VANCINTDPDTQTAIINIINAQPFVIPLCVGEPPAPGTTPGETCVDVSNGCPAVFYIWSGTEWVPSVCPTPPEDFLLQENGDLILQEN